MKNLDLNSMGVNEMSVLEMQETEGGLIGLIIIGVCAILVMSSCGNNFSIQIGGINNTINNSQVADSTLNGNSADGNSLDLAKRYNMPIGY